MPEPIDNRLIYEVLKDVQVRLANLEGMRSEMREGFASRAHMATRHGDAAFIERRVVELERDVERIKHRLDLVDDPEGAEDAAVGEWLTRGLRNSEGAVRSQVRKPSSLALSRGAAIR